MEGLRRGLGAPVGRARGGPARGRGRARDEGAGGDVAEGGGEAIIVCGARRGAVVWIVDEWVVGVAGRKIVDGDATDDWSKQARQDPLACERPKLLPRHSLEPKVSINLILDSSLALLIHLIYYRACKRAELLSPAHQSFNLGHISCCASLQSSQI